MSKAVFTTLETTRLRMRHFMDSDLALFMAYRTDPKVSKYQGWEGISEPEARAFIQEQKEVQPGVPGQWGMSISMLSCKRNGGTFAARRDPTTGKTEYDIIYYDTLKQMPVSRREPWHSANTSS